MSDFAALVISADVAIYAVVIWRHFKNQHPTTKPGQSNAARPKNTQRGRRRVSLASLGSARHEHQHPNTQHPTRNGS